MDNVKEKTLELVSELEAEEQAARDSFKAFKLDFYKKNSVYAKVVKEIQAYVWRLKPNDSNFLLRCSKEVEFATEGKIVFENFLSNYRKKVPKKHLVVLKDFNDRVSVLNSLTVELVDKQVAFEKFLNATMFPSLFFSEKQKLKRDLPLLWGKLREQYLFAYTDTTVMTGIIESEEASYSEELPK